MIHKVMPFDIAMAALEEKVTEAVALLCRAAGHTRRFPLPRTDLTWSIASPNLRRGLLLRWMVGEAQP